MSKTYKHQLLHRYHHDRKSLSIMEYARLPGTEYPRAGYFYKQSHRQRRLRVKDLLRQGKYTEAKHLKERNVDWEIW